MAAWLRATSRLRRGAAVLLLAGCSVLARAGEPVSVVYHVSEGLAQAQRAIVNIRNHLNAEPTTKIVVVGLAQGIDFLLEGAKNEQGQEFSAAVSELAGRGVEFRVCDNTLKGRSIPKDRVIMEASIVASGVAEIGKLQAEKHFAYIKP